MVSREIVCDRKRPAEASSSWPLWWVTLGYLLAKAHFSGIWYLAGVHFRLC